MERDKNKRRAQAWVRNNMSDSHPRALASFHCLVRVANTTRYNLSDLRPLGLEARSIPAWGEAPRTHVDQNQGAAHRSIPAWGEAPRTQVRPSLKTI
jgi:hypothetical protein